ncbi:MAG: phosphatidate cytidylyltransferase [Treponema sp.]|nr:phosphatidate cytidylyltransferase [Treponema sp.]
MKDSKTILKELFRKSIHICCSVVPWFLANYYWYTVYGLYIIVSMYYFCEIARLEGHPVPVVSLITETASRQRDECKFVLGPVTLVLGIVFAALVLPLPCAKIGIFALAFGDGLASLGGKLFGRVKLPYTGGKTLEGSLTCFTAVFISTFIVSGHWVVSLIVAFVAMLIEMFPLGDWDNMIIPTFTGGVYWLLSALWL